MAEKTIGLRALTERDSDSGEYFPYDSREYLIYTLPRVERILAVAKSAEEIQNENPVLVLIGGRHALDETNICL